MKKLFIVLLILVLAIPFTNAGGSEEEQQESKGIKSQGCC